MQAQYVGELEALEKSFQAKGALEDLFAAKAERQRFIETPLLVESNLVDKPELLRELQQKYLELQQGVSTKVAEEFIARLEQQKQAFTIEGKLEEAINAKQSAEKLSARFLTSGANASAKSPEKMILGRWHCKLLGGRFECILRYSPNGDVFGAPVSAPASEGLCGKWRMQDGLPFAQYFEGHGDKITAMTENEIQFVNTKGEHFVGKRIK